MKKLLTSAFVLIMVFGLHSAATAQISVGGGLGYGTNIEEIGLKVDGVYTINEDFRAGADIIYFFVGGDVSFWELNLNGNYIFTQDDAMTIYGLAGINYARQSVSSEWGSWSNSEVGLNIGAGLEYDLGFATIAPEIKYALSTFDQLVVSAGLRFPIN
jgi:opacity protein-like surface antigen